MFWSIHSDVDFFFEVDVFLPMFGAIVPQVV